MPIQPTDEDQQRIATVVARSIEVFEGALAASSWLKAKNSALGGRTPWSLLVTDSGVDAAIRTLGRIEQGVLVQLVS
jgi:putative toxin-antitoxin system antitoxin component (TIGR02293 family)